MHHVHRPPGSWSWVTLIGPDAQDFLHRITTAQVRALSVGQGTEGCFLNAQGKIRAPFTLWHYRESEFALELDGGTSGHWKQELLAAIDQSTFSEKITLGDATGPLACAWIFPQGQFNLAPPPGETRAIEDEIRLCNHGERAFGRVWLTAWARPARLEQWLDREVGSTAPISAQELERLRVAAMTAWPDREIIPDSNPLELGMIEAVAPNKGCYPGQEVIEKIVALGSPAKRLVLLQGDGRPPLPGEKIASQAEPPAELGQITSSASSDRGGFIALALVRKIHAKEGFAVKCAGGAAATVQKVAPYAR